MDFLEGLNEYQKEAVKSTEGNIIVLAGAGTGKTKTLTMRYAYLLEKGNKTDNILCLTFTNQASKEMKERIGKITGKKIGYKSWVGTIHGICVRVLMKDGIKLGIEPGFTIANESEQKNLINEICSNYSNISQEPEDILYEISKCKNGLLYPSDLVGSEDHDEDFINIYIEYQEKLMNLNALDFDDLILKTHELLTKSSEVRNKYQKMFKYTMVDESQDLNKSQFELINLFSNRSNMFLIGDTDQGIYSWRGANISIVRDFSQLEDVRLIELPINYRSNTKIIEASNKLISYNTNRIKKELKPHREDEGSIILYEADNQYRESEFIAEVINYKVSRQGYNYKDMAVIYRTNVQSRDLEQEFRKMDIPYKIVNGNSFYDRKEIKDMIAYLKVVINPKNALSLERVINCPKRGVGKGTLEKMIKYGQKNKLHLIDVFTKEHLDNISRMRSDAKDALYELRKTILYYYESYQNYEISEIIKKIATDVGYLDMLDEQGEDERVLNVYELANVDLITSDTLIDFVNKISLLSDADNIAHDNSVNLMTVHTAKGLEFPIVFLCGLEEDTFPHYLSLKNNSAMDLREERRLCYVGMTRAEDELYLTHAKVRYLWGKKKDKKPSRFLEEIPSHIVDKI